MTGGPARATGGAATGGGAGRTDGPPSLSADGRYAAWLSAGDGATRLVVHDLAARREHGRSDVGAARCRAFTWSHLPGVGLALSDPDGSESWTLFRVDVADGTWTPLGAPGRRTRLAGLSPQRPEEVLLAAEGGEPGRLDHHLVSLRTGARTEVLRDRGYAAVYADTSLRPRLTETVGDDGSRDLWHGEPTAGRPFLHVPHEDALTVRFLAFAPDGDTAYFVLPDGPDGVRLTALACRDGAPARELRTEHRVRGGDIPDVLFEPGTGRPGIVQTERERRACVALDPRWAPVLEHLRTRLGTEPVVTERRGGRWLVAAHRPEHDTHWYVHEPAGGDTWRLGAARPGTPPSSVTCRAVGVPLRGGGEAVTYVTRGTARGDGDGPGPAVLLVHGGPWRRSRWEYAERRTWLAERGCTVIEPNFRGSTGFGPAWTNAADRQWGLAMQDDLEDALDWAVAEGVADPDRLALVGGSYGGYAVLQMAATTRRDLRCVVATSPLTDLVRFLEEPPAFWRTAAPMLHRRVGDPADPDQRAALRAVSPVDNAAGVRCPVLLVHGANDSRVPAEMATRMFMALARAGKDATLALFPDEGHEVVTTGNRAALHAVTAAHLDTHLFDRPPAADAGPPGDTTLKLFDTPHAARRKAASAPDPGDVHGTALHAQ
ncbi:MULTISPECIES: alpha/beta fold hydrolase [Streptomyces]|uniref:Peptidase S9 prolyl oligopeptidase catalytic domain-containing protein n=2 Tax=Streptomyces TaxID=1883 RepID=A0A124ECP5_9ACTN|nr:MULTISPECIES: alpha/beta fold hydrolase [Streptomyces]KUH38193.1 hypothetical protein ATE80_14060 [Streptomyces kanasensis]UUS33518.1 alpha/beta fold hydrolase [Streptomyces changanensis]